MVIQPKSVTVLPPEIMKTHSAHEEVAAQVNTYFVGKSWSRPILIKVLFKLVSVLNLNQVLRCVETGRSTSNNAYFWS
jgi:hypothetical protein